MQICSTELKSNYSILRRIQFYWHAHSWKYRRNLIKLNLSCIETTTECLFLTLFFLYELKIMDIWSLSDEVCIRVSLTLD